MKLKSLSDVQSIPEMFGNSSLREWQQVSHVKTDQHMKMFAWRCNIAGTRQFQVKRPNQSQDSLMTMTMMKLDGLRNE